MANLGDVFMQFAQGRVQQRREDELAQRRREQQLADTQAEMDWRTKEAQKERDFQSKAQQRQFEAEDLRNKQLVAATFGVDDISSLTPEHIEEINYELGRITSEIESLVSLTPQEDEALRKQTGYSDDLEKKIGANPDLVVSQQAQNYFDLREQKLKAKTQDIRVQTLIENASLLRNGLLGAYRYVPGLQLASLKAYRRAYGNPGGDPGDVGSDVEIPEKDELDSEDEESIASRFFRRFGESVSRLFENEVLKPISGSGPEQVPETGTDPDDPEGSPRTIILPENPDRELIGALGQLPGKMVDAAPKFAGWFQRQSAVSPNPVGLSPSQELNYFEAKARKGALLTPDQEERRRFLQQKTYGALTQTANDDRTVSSNFRRPTQ